MKYWIRERDGTPQGLPLQRLIKEVRQQLGPSAARCAVTRSEGYGLQVNEWDRALDDDDAVVVDAGVLEALSAGTEEWFYNLDAAFADSDVRFGLHDSTALYIDGPESVAKAVVAGFEDVSCAT